MAKTKTFPLNVVLTVTTGRLLTMPDRDSGNGIGQLYEILNWMTNDDLFTHQLPRAGKECGPWLFRWFPELSDVSMELLDECLAEDTTEKKTAFLDEFIRRQRQANKLLKSEYEIPQIPRDDHDVINPVDELVAIVGKDRVIVVETE